LVKGSAREWAHSFQGELSRSESWFSPLGGDWSPVTKKGEKKFDFPERSTGMSILKTIRNVTGWSKTGSRKEDVRRGGGRRREERIKRAHHRSEISSDKRT